MRHLIPVLLLMIAFACSPGQDDQGTSPSTRQERMEALWASYDENFLSFLQQAHQAIGKTVLTYTPISDRFTIPKRMDITGTHHDLGLLIGHLAQHSGRGPGRAKGGSPPRAPDASSRKTSSVDFQTRPAQTMGDALPPKKRRVVDEADAARAVARKARVSTVLGRTPFGRHAARRSGQAFGRYLHRNPHDWGMRHDP